MKRKLILSTILLLCIGIMLVPFTTAVTANDTGNVDEAPSTGAYYKFTERIEPMRALTIAYLIAGLDIEGTTANCYGDCMGVFADNDIDLTITLEKYIGFGEWGYYYSWYSRDKAIPGVIMSKYKYNLPVGSYRVYADTYTHYGAQPLEHAWLWTDIRRVDPPRP